MGTVKIDIASQLSTHRFRPDDNVYEVAPVFARVGGTAMNFAGAAAELFRVRNVIAAIGDDGLTDFLVAAVKATCSTASLQRCADQANAIVVTVRDAPDPAGRRARLLVSSEQSPHTCLTPEHIHACRTVIESSDFLVCDGYALQHATSTSALVAALELARRARVRTVLDLVPHDLPATIPMSRVMQVVSRADVIVSEARTAVGVSEGRWPVGFASDAPLIRRATAAARTIAPAATWILRYGFENIGNTRMLWPDGAVADSCTTYRREKDRHLYGDRLLARELYWMLPNERDDLRNDRSVRAVDRQ